MGKRTFEWEGVEYGSAEYYRLWRKANNEKSRQWHREYDRRMYKEHPERELARRQRYAKKHPNKIKAHQLLNQALKSGKIVKLPCQVCQAGIRVVAHHDDYSKPLEVVWLCELHHKERHVVNGESLNG